MPAPEGSIARLREVYGDGFVRLPEELTGDVQYDPQGNILGQTDEGEFTDEQLYQDLIRQALLEFPGSDVPERVKEGAIEAVPEWAQEFLQKQGETAFGEAAPDQRALDAQYQALEGLQDVYQQGGLTDIDRARQARTRGIEDATLRGQRESTLRSMQERGMSGGGMELLSQLSGQQESAMRANQANLGTESMALQRRDQALRGLSDVGGSMAQQSWGRASDVASARDVVNRFNAAGARDVEARRVDQEQKGQLLGWTAGEAQKERETAAENQRRIYSYQDKYGREKDRMQALAALGAGTDIGYKGAEQQARSNDIAQQQANMQTATGIAQIAGSIF